MTNDDRNFGLSHFGFLKSENGILETPPYAPKQSRLFLIRFSARIII